MNHTVASPQIWSVGHSNHSFDDFLHILLSQQIELVVDVRSSPFSRYSAHFNQEILEVNLKESGVSYRFMGDSLGGRPPELDLYDETGRVLYRELSKHFRFMNGLEQLCIAAESERLAMMCSEGSPEHCHRRLLIGRVLLEQGVDVLHIHGDGVVKSDSELRAIHGPHQVVSLFGEEEDPWLSTQPVLRSGQLSNSSNNWS